MIDDHYLIFDNAADYNVSSFLERQRVQFPPLPTATVKDLIPPVTKTSKLRMIDRTYQLSVNIPDEFRYFFHQKNVYCLLRLIE